MTAAERVEYEDEEEQVSDQQCEAQQGVQKEQGHEEPGQVQEQGKEVEQGESQEEPTSVTVETVVTVDAVVEQDGVAQETNHEEVRVTQVFSTEEPQPEGPDESLQDGKAEEEECGFCLFMKAGPCGKRFTAWEVCVDDAETSGKNIVEKCAQMTRYLKECMESNPEYYGPVLQAEKAMDEQAALEGPKDGEEKSNSNNLEPIPA